MANCSTPDRHAAARHALRETDPQRGARGLVEEAKGRVEEWIAERLARHREPGEPHRAAPRRRPLGADQRAKDDRGRHSRRLHQHHRDQARRGGTARGAPRRPRRRTLVSEKNRGARDALDQAVEISLAPGLLLDLLRPARRRDRLRAQEADDLLLRHRRLHRDDRRAGIGGADRSAQPLPDRDVEDRARARRHDRQVYRRRHPGLLRRSRDARRAAGCDRLRRDGDRDAAPDAGAAVANGATPGSRSRSSCASASTPAIARSAISAARTGWTTPSSAAR